MFPDRLFLDASDPFPSEALTGSVCLNSDGDVYMFLGDVGGWIQVTAAAEVPENHGHECCYCGSLTEEPTRNCRNCGAARYR